MGFSLDNDLIKITNCIYYFLNNRDKRKFNSFNISIKLRDINIYVKNLIDLKLDYVNKIFRRYLKHTLFKELVNLVLVVLLVRNSSRLLVEFLVIKFKNIKNQNKILFYLKLILLDFMKKDVFVVKGLKL